MDELWKWLSPNGGGLAGNLLTGKFLFLDKDGDGGDDPPADPPADPEPPADPPPSGDPTPKPGETSLDLTGIQKQLDNISAKLRKDSTDPETLKQLNALNESVAALGKEPEDSERITALEKEVAAGRHALEVQAVVVKYKLTDKELETIMTDDIEALDKRAENLRSMFTSSDRKAVVTTYPEGIKGNSESERLLDQMNRDRNR